jgi:hypothetical protein
MLTIRPQQMAAFEEAMLLRFEDEMVVHSKEFSPKLTEVIGDEQVRIAVRRCIRRAGEYGFTLRGPIRLYIEMMFLYGSGFDSDPQYPWAARILRSQEEQMQRAESIYEEILRYQENVSGTDGVNTTKALQRLANMARSDLQLTSDDFTVRMRHDMHLTFPEKARYVGEDALIVLIRDGTALAQKHRFPSPRGEMLLTTLMFAFGHGCTDDPLYPWISNTLADEKITDPDLRARRLEGKARTWLEHVIAKLQDKGQT